MILQHCKLVFYKSSKTYGESQFVFPSRYPVDANFIFTPEFRTHLRNGRTLSVLTKMGIHSERESNQKITLFSAFRSRCHNSMNLAICNIMEVPHCFGDTFLNVIFQYLFVETSKKNAANIRSLVFYWMERNYRTSYINIYRHRYEISHGMECSL